MENILEAGIGSEMNSYSGVAKLDRRCRLPGRSELKISENKVRTSGSPSRYQVGADLYMGGEIKYMRPRNLEQTSTRTERIC